MRELPRFLQVTRFFLEDLFHIWRKRVYEVSLDELRKAVGELANQSPCTDLD